MACPCSIPSHYLNKNWLIEHARGNKLHTYLNQNKTPIQENEVKMSIAKWWPFCIGRSELNPVNWTCVVLHCMVKQRNFVCKVSCISHVFTISNWTYTRFVLNTYIQICIFLEIVMTMDDEILSHKTGVYLSHIINIVIADDLVTCNVMAVETTMLT